MFFTDPFERSMALWMIKEYAQAASTLVDEASRDRMLNGHNDSAATAASVFTGVQQHSLFDIFNFYVFLRKHPLVVRQRLTNAGILVTSTEQFLALAKQLESRMTASERRLYFRTASAHIALGCPLLALDVLSRMPKHFSLADGNLLNITRSASFATTESTPMENVQKAEDIDWSAPINTIGEDQLELDWGEENKIDDKKNEDEADNWKKNRLDETKDNTFTFSKNSDEDQQMDYETNDSEINPERIVDFISQHLKYVAVLRILMDELSTLASGFEINGGQLRYELFNWLEKECDILHEICDFRTGDFQSEPAPEIDAFMVSLNEIDSDRDGDGFSSIPQSTAHGDGRADLPLHESLRLDRLNFKLRLRAVVRRRNWLRGHEKLLRIFVAYCSLHSAQNYRLTSIQMELLLLLLEVQSDGGVTRFFAKEPLPYIHSFPLLISALSSCRMFVTSPLQFMRNQSDDILGTFCEFVEPPSVENSFAEVLMIYNLCQGLSSCVYQSLSDIFQFPLAYSSTSGLNGACALTANVIAHYFATADEVQVRTPAAKWPGVESFIALLGRERDEDTPDLRLLLVEFFTAIIVSLFAYALTVYDARWLFRLCAHRLDERAFSTIFGGGGERRLRSTISTRPSPPIANIDKARFAVDSTLIDASQADSAAIRAKLHAKVFGADLTRGKISQTSTSAMLASMTTASSASEQSVTCWVPPTKHIVQFFAEKVNAVDAGNLSPACAYDSESEDTLEDGFVGDDNEEDADFDTEEANVRAVTYSYAWLLLRLASSIHIQQRIHEFVTLSGFDIQDIAMTSAHMDNILRTLRDWTRCLEKQLDAFEGGCPENFLRNMQITTTPATIHQTPLLRKYSTLLESGNTPFEAQTRASSSARRLWCFLIRQEHLSPYFVKHIFGRTDMTDDKETSTSNGTISTPLNSAAGNGTFLPSYHNSISEPMKIVQREHEPIVAFACNSLRPSCIVVSSGREVQEINLNRIFDENDENSDFGVQKLSMVGGAFDLNDYGGGFLNSRVELDIAMQSLQRDTLRDNDDYQLITPHDHYGHGHYAYHGHHGSGVANGIGGGKLVGGVTCLTSFIIDRSRVALKKMRKRPISGIRRLEAHSILPYYVSGSTDGSILLWEWGVEQPLFTARVAGQYAKVAKLAFAQNANKFAAVDGDGLLCIWQAAQHCTSSRPFFSQRCHSKTATDVKFLGQTSSLLVTAGHGAGEQNVALWDTLMPSAKAMVHAFSNQHQEGATCVLYVPNSQSILSGGRHGEICVWDLRQCQLRAAFRAFDSGSVRCMCLDASGDAFVAGSSEGDIKVWSTMDSMLSQSQPQPSLLYSLSCEHVARSGFTLRKLGGSSGVAGVQQVFVDARQRLFSCGADSSLKFRTLPPAHFAV